MHPQQQPGGSDIPVSHPPTPPPPATQTFGQLTLGDALTAGGGLLVFLASFLPFVSLDKGARGPFIRGNFDLWWNAWSFETFMAPLTWFIALAGIAIAITAALRFLTGTTARLASFSLTQIEAIGALFITVTTFGYAASTKSLYFGSEWADSLDPEWAKSINFGIGGYLMLAGGIVATVGAILNLRNSGPILVRSR